MTDTTATETAMHPAMQTVLEAMHEHIAGYEIPDDGTGVLDVDALIASIGPFMQGLGEVFTGLGTYLSENPVNVSVCEMLTEFAGATGNMAEDATAVHTEWQTNPDNAHDLARAHGEISNAHLFNVGA